MHAQTGNLENRHLTHTEPNASEDSSRDDGFPIVGIGASAGGLAALRTFFQNVPANPGVAFVVVVHLSPNHESHLAELLRGSLKVPIQQVTNTTRIEPNHAYVIPPDANLESVDTHLRLSPLEERRAERLPIDHFFRTLARTHSSNAIGVVLTGMGSDGTLGLREIKQQGGFTIVQDPANAEFDGMPRSAIFNGMVDLVAPLESIPGEVLRLVSTRPRLGSLSEGSEGAQAKQQKFLAEVFLAIRQATGRDFSHYKESTLLRRIARRMQFNNVESPDDYLRYLKQHPEEANVLADDLLIIVTSFFRDAKVFEVLEADIIPNILAGKAEGDRVRVWAAGCATGEEAYSLAMLLLEAVERTGAKVSVQVFASDLHAKSLEKAREGSFPGDIEVDVSEERLKRFFHKEDGGYRIRNSVRECVVFAPHNLISDPPFSRLDLISCRNLLIYLQRDLQRKLIELFHYSLKPGGFLVLGTSETVDSSELFRETNKDCAVYSKRNVPYKEPSLPVFPIGTSRSLGASTRNEREREPIAYQSLYHALLEQYAPPSLLISPDDRVLHLSPHAGRFLVHPAGSPTTSVAKLIRPELRVELRAVLAQVRRRGASVRSVPVLVKLDAEMRTLVLSAVPATGTEQEGFVLVVIEERAGTVRSPTTEQQEGSSNGNAVGSSRLTDDEASPLSHSNLQLVIDELQADQTATYRRLETLIEEHETSQEELRASNEELQSANEELRSTLEELETSKEELQSMNEELQTVNQENRHKVEELAQLSGDLQNLLSSTSIATLFLDRELRIQRFTPKTAEMFNVLATDRGRPISDITHRLGYDRLKEDAETVLAELAPIERVIHDDRGRSYLTRVLAYRSTDDRIAGTVLTFVDITDRVAVERALRISEAKYRALFNSIDEGFVVLEPVGTSDQGPPRDFRIVEANAAFEALTAQRRVMGLTWRQLFAGEDESWFQAFQAVLGEQKAHRFEHTLTTLGRTIQVEVFRAGNSEGQEIGVLLQDITERKSSEQRLRQSEAFHRLAVQAGGVGTWSRQADATMYDVSAQMAVLLGFRNSQSGKDEPSTLQLSEEQWQLAVHPDDRQSVNATLTDFAPEGRTFSMEFRVMVGETTRWLYATGGIHRDAKGEKAEIRGAAIDVTERKKSEEALRKNEERLALELAAMKHLHALVTRLLECPDTASALSEVLASTVEVTGAQMGCIQTFDPRTGRLSIAAGQRLPAQLFEQLQAQKVTDATGWSELQAGHQVLWTEETGGEVELQRAKESGYRAFRISPLISRREEFLGLLSTFFENPRCPSQRDSWTLDLYARQAADLLDRIEAEDALRQSEAQFRAVFEVSAAAAVEIAPSSGEILRMNETFSKMTGYLAAECIGRSIWDLVSPADREARPGFGMAFNEAGTFQKELRIVRKDGTEFWGLVAANLVAHSSPDRAMVLILDVTSRRDAESILKEQNRHKDEFIAMLGHELRNPLAAIRNATDVLKLIPSDDHRIRRAHNALERQSGQMSRLIDGLLEISRIARGKVKVDFETVDLREILEAILEDREAEIEKHGLNLVRNLPETPVWLLADPSRMAQVFENLVGNAIKFTPRPGTITVSLETDGDHCVVRIRDTGRGMRAEVLTRIFEAFHQDEQDGARSSGGLGLGLALAKGLLDLHHGVIEAHSAGPGQGAEFRVRLPLGNPPSKTSRPPPLGEERALDILLVEDNPDASEMLAGLLEIRGHSVMSVERAESALEFLQVHRPDLILCDIGLPGMSGFEFAQKFRSEHESNQTYLVALTGYGQPRDRDMAKAAGFDRHLVKPLDLKKLEAVLSSAASTRR